MKLRKFLRLGALTLALSLLLGSNLGVLAAEDQSYRERRYEMELPFQPQWEEQEVSCSSVLGTLRGTLTVPKDAEGKLPVAILLHGLNTDRRWCDDIAWSLADNGIASVRFDYGGCGESDGQQQDMSISTELRDTLAILDYVKGLSLTDQENIFVVGKSMGGVEAALAAKSRAGDIKALCLWYPGFNAAATTQHGMLLGQFFNPFDPPETMEIAGFTYGRDFIREAQALDCVSICQSVQQPVLILHGDADFVVPLVSSIALEPQFPDAELKVFPGGGHGFWGLQELEALGDMVSFLKDHID